MPLVSHVAHGAYNGTGLLTATCCCSYSWIPLSACSSEGVHAPSNRGENFLLDTPRWAGELPPDFARRLAEVLQQAHVDRSQAIRQLFEDSVAGE